MRRMAGSGWTAHPRNPLPGAQPAAARIAACCRSDASPSPTRNWSNASCARPGRAGRTSTKVATAVELRFDIANSPSLPEPVRERLLAKRDRRVTADGVLVIAAQRFRTQGATARTRANAWRTSSKPACTRQAAAGDQPSRASKERRLEAKRGRSTIKQGRARRDWD